MVNCKSIAIVIAMIMIVMAMGGIGSAAFPAPTFCYQESANVSNQNGSDGNCGLNYGGSYHNFVDDDGYNAWDNITACIDGNWSTPCNSIGIPNPLGSAYNVTYIKPKTAVGGIILLRLGYSYYNQTSTIPYSMFNQNDNNLIYRVTSPNGAAVNVKYYDSSGNAVLLNGSYDGGGYNVLWEEGVVWEINTMVENNQYFNTTTYETARESFTINITYTSDIPSAVFYYAGASYPSSQTILGNKVFFTASLDVPTVSSPTNMTFYWNVTIGGVQYQSTVHNQTIDPIRLQICNATFNVTYANFTFKDEATDAYMSAMTDLSTWTYHLGSGTTTKTYLFTNLTANPSYAYCFSPADRTFSSNVVYQYSNTSYPQRYYSADTTYSNTTTNKLLYLLGSGGLYVSFIAQNPLGNAPISGVTIVVERQFAGIWTQVGQAISDSAGSTTFWLNPNYDHRVTASKTGYTSQTMTVKPSQSVYTIVMGSTAYVTNYTWKGIAWNVGPKDFTLAPNTTYTFFFNASAIDSNIVKCKMELRNTTDYLMTTFEGTATNNGAYCIATGTYSDNNNSYQLNGYYYLDLGSGYGLLKAKDPWLFENYTADNNLNLFDLLKNFNDLEDWGSTHNRQEFSKIVAFFFVMIMLLGAFTYYTGYDFAQPGAGLLVLWGLVVLGSFAGIFNIQGLSIPAFSFFDKYTIAMIVTFLTWGFLLNHWRRANG